MSDFTHKVKLWGQLKHLTGHEYVDVTNAASIDELIFKLSKEKSEISHFLIADEKPNPSILVFINDEQHVWGNESTLSPNASITIMSPIAGG